MSISYYADDLATPSRFIEKLNRQTQDFERLLKEVRAIPIDVGGVIYPEIAVEVGLVVDNTYPIGCWHRYGAVGDGATDDTAAIQAACDVMHLLFAGSSGTAGGRSYGLPGYEYLITAAIVLGNFTDVDLNGALIVQDTDNTPAFKITKGVFNQFVRLRNGRITWTTQQTEASHPLSYGLQLYDANVISYDVKMLDIRVENGAGAVRGPAALNGAAFIVTVDHVIASQCSSWAFLYEGLTGTTFHTYSNCWAVQQDGSEIATSKGYSFTNLYNLNCNNLAADHLQTTAILFLATCFGKVSNFCAESCDISGSSSQLCYVRISNSTILADHLRFEANEVTLTGSAEFGAIVIDTSDLDVRFMQDNQTVLSDSSSGGYNAIYCSGTGNRVWNRIYRHNASGSPAPSGGIVEAGPPVQVLMFNGSDRARYEGGKYVGYGTAAPASGTYAVGDRVWNTAPDTTTNLIAGWECLTAGTPGTWKPMPLTDTGTYTATLTGCTSSPTGTIRYTRVGNLVHLRIPLIQGTSNSTTATLTGMPANIRPVRAQTPIMRITDNTLPDIGFGIIQTTGVIDLGKRDVSAFTPAGGKGTEFCNCSYSLD